MEQLQIEVKTFDQLHIEELYDLLQLRSEVFVVEQDCVYQDIDGKDREALHILGKKREILWRIPVASNRDTILKKRRLVVWW